MTTPEIEPAREIPDFSLPASTGQTLSLDSYRGRVPVVLVFLSDLESEEDRRTLSAFDDRLGDFGAERSQVFAVVKETARAVRDYADSHQMSMPILADASGSMIRDYETDDDEGNPRRVVVVADKTGELVRRFDPIPIDGDMVERALETVRGIKAGAVTVEESES